MTGGARWRAALEGRHLTPATQVFMHFSEIASDPHRAIWSILRSVQLHGSSFVILACLDRLRLKIHPFAAA
jgi:hypothetical protein